MSSRLVMMSDDGGSTYTVNGLVPELYRILNDCRLLQALLVPSTLTCSNANFDKMNEELTAAMDLIQEAIDGMPSHESKMTNIKLDVTGGNL